MNEETLELENCCAYCEHSSPLRGDEYAVCEKKGVVRMTFVCRKFAYDPLKRRPAKIIKPEFEYVDLDS